MLTQEVALSLIIFTAIFVDNKEHLLSKKCLQANYTPEYIVFQCLGFKPYGFEADFLRLICLIVAVLTGIFLNCVNIPSFMVC